MFGKRPRKSTKEKSVHGMEVKDKKKMEDAEEEEDMEESLDEERRLLYVGMTRAKRKLYLLYRSRATIGGGGSEVGERGKVTKTRAKNIPVKPSRFLSDLPKGTRFSRAQV